MLSGSPASGPASIRPSPARTPPSSRGFSQCLLLLNALWLPGQLPNHREPPQQAGGPVQPLVHRSDTGDKGPAQGPALPSPFPQAISTARPSPHGHKALPPCPGRTARDALGSQQQQQHRAEAGLLSFFFFNLFYPLIFLWYMASPSRWALAVLSSLLSLQTGLDARPSTRHTPGSAGTGEGGKRRPENFAGSLLVPRNDVSKHACPSRGPASFPLALAGLRGA